MTKMRRHEWRVTKVSDDAFNPRAYRACDHCNAYQYTRYIRKDGDYTWEYFDNSPTECIERDVTHD
jgi:hypothetical protein